MRSRLGAFASVAALCLTFVSQAAATPIVTFTGGTTTTAFANRTFGFSFATTANPLEIFSLGYWDEDGNGLNQSHQVGIWTGDGSTLLASAIIPAGVAGTLDSGFRFVAIAPIVLPGSSSFLAGAFLGNASDAIIRFTSASTTASIVLGSTAFDPSPFSGVFAAPTGTQGTAFDDGYFGPNFNGEVSPAAVPEPATMTLMGLGLAGLYARARKNRK